MDMEMDSRNCIFCGQSSNLLCQRCFDSYCSIRCQMLDWSKHKLICRPLPQLISKERLNSVINHSASEVASLNNSSQSVMQNFHQSSLLNSSQSFSNSNTKTEAVNFTPMRRPRTEKFDQNLPFVASNGAINKSELEEYNEKNLFKTKPPRAPKLNHPSLTDINKNKQLDKPLVEKTYPKGDVVPLFPFETKSNKTEKTEYFSAAIHTTNKLQNDGKLLDSNKISEKIREKNAWKAPFEVPNGKFFNVIVQYYDSKQKIAWVTDCSLVDNQTKLLSQININLKNMTQVTKDNIYKNALYAAEFDGAYYRAICLQEADSSNQVKLRLIDYGNVFSTDCQKLKLPIEIMNNLPSYAFCIHYPTILEVDQEIKIKIFDKINDPVVGNFYLIEEDRNGKIIKFDLTSEPIQDLSLPKNHTLSSLPNEFDVILINFIDKIRNTAVLRVLQKKVQNELDKMNEILNSEKTFDYDLISTPKKGDFVVGRWGKFWKRGILVGKLEKEFLIFFTDFGEIEFVQQIKQIPSDYRDLPHQIILIKFNKILIDEKNFYDTRFTVDIKVKIKNFNSQDSTPKCSLFNEDGDLADVTLKNFEGNVIKLMQNNLWKTNKAHRMIIRITNVIDHCTVYIGLDSICDSYGLKINAIGKQLEEFKLLQQNPEFHINEIVLVKQNTSEYVRCRILKFEDDCVVEDIDTGKIFTVKNDAIFTAIDLLKVMPAASTKYTLNILNKIEPCDAKLNNALHQLKSYCEEKKRFILKIENPIEEGIELSPVDDETQTINKTLIPLLFQKIKQEEEVLEQKKDIEINCQKKSVVNNIVENQLDEQNKMKDKEITKYYIDSIEIQPIKCGEKVEILVLDNGSIKQGIISAGIKDIPFIQKLLGEYKEEINKFCNDASNGADYIPEVDELCLAIFDQDGEWYRAYCMEKPQNGKICLMFFDFGNVVVTDQKKIRKFDERFLYKSLANTCLIEGFPKSPDPKKVEFLSENIFKPFSIFTADSVKKLAYCEYSVKFDGIQQHFEQ